MSIPIFQFSNFAENEAENANIIFIYHNVLTKLFLFRKLEVDNLPFISHAVSKQQMMQLPNIEGFAWDEIHPAQGPPGWNEQLFWRWENVRLLLVFVPAKMKSDTLRSVIIMYRPVGGPTSINNNFGFQSPILARIKVKRVYESSIFIWLEGWSAKHIKYIKYVKYIRKRFLSDMIF